MARRPAATTLMKKAVDNKDPHMFMWALLELSRRELHRDGKFSTLSATDIKNILQALLDKPQESKSSSETATLYEIEQYMNKK